MIYLPVSCKANPFVRFLGLDAGEIDFERGITCLIYLCDEHEHVLDRKPFYLKGEDFHKWMFEPDGHESFKAKVLLAMNCILRPPV